MAKKRTTEEPEETVDEEIREEPESEEKTQPKPMKKAKSDKKADEAKEEFEKKVTRLITYRNDYLSKKPSQADSIIVFDFILYGAGIIDAVDLAKAPTPIEAKKDISGYKGSGKKYGELLDLFESQIMAYQTDLACFICNISTMSREHLFKGRMFEEMVKYLKTAPMSHMERLESVVIAQMIVEGACSEEAGVSLHAFDLIPIAKQSKEFCDNYSQKDWTLTKLFYECGAILAKRAKQRRGPMAFDNEEVDDILVDLVMKESPKANAARTQMTCNPPENPSSVPPAEPQPAPAKKPSSEPELTEEEIKEAKKKAMKRIEDEKYEKMKKAAKRREALEKKKAEAEKKKFEEAEKKRKESGQMSLFDFLDDNQGATA